MLPCCIKRLAHSSQWHTSSLSFAQIIETGYSYIVWDANAAFLKRVQRAKCHSVIRRDDRLKTELAFIQQCTNRGSSAFRRIIAVRHHVFIEAQVVRFE